MMEFNGAQFKQEFKVISNELALSLQQADESSAKEMIAAVLETVDIMERAEADLKAGYDSVDKKDVTQIGDYMLSLLMALGDMAGQRSMSQTMLYLHRLSLPVAMWVSQHGGEIKQLEIIVNAIATLANEIKDTTLLAEFSQVIDQIIVHVSDDIRRDLEAANQMRPWLILNMNWGIVATRSHDVEIMRRVFDQLIKNIPADVRQFFQEGMQQMTIVNYPNHVREVMQEYHQMLGGGVSLS